MHLDRRILSYLNKYGNTREKDLINYASHELGVSHKGMKKAIDRLATLGRIYRIVHCELQPPEVYLTLMEPLPVDILELEGEPAKSENFNDEVAQILEEAAALAESRHKELG